MSGQEDIIAESVAREHMSEGNKIDDGGMAFPMADLHLANGNIQYGNPGMTLREYYAGQIIAGMLADQKRDGRCDAYAYDAVCMADALIAALKVTP